MYERLVSFIKMLYAETETDFVYYYRKTTGKKADGKSTAYYLKRWGEFKQ